MYNYFPNEEDPVIQEIVDWLYAGENRTAALHGVAALAFGFVVGLGGLSWFQFAATLTIGGYGLRTLSDLIDSWRHDTLDDRKWVAEMKDWITVPTGLLLAAAILMLMGRIS